MICLLSIPTSAVDFEVHEKIKQEDGLIGDEAGMVMC